MVQDYFKYLTGDEAASLLGVFDRGKLFLQVSGKACLAVFSFLGILISKVSWEYKI